MTERQDKIIKTLIQEYIKTAEPVGSESLTENYNLPFSSATVRAELAWLEEAGYLTQPHTSAGRIPTDKGYRYFVDETIKNDYLTKNELNRLKSELLNLQTQHNRLARGTAKLLAGLSQNLAVAGLIDRDDFHEAGLPELIKEPEFADAECLLDVSKILEVLEDNFDDMVSKLNKTPRIYIGEENPFADVKHLSMILAACDLPSGERGLLAIIGPTRMRYEHNIHLLNAVADIIESEGRRE
jgi:heat-inducible transcriptional repressor